MENHEYVHAVQYASVTESDDDMQATTIVKKASCGYQQSTTVKIAVHTVCRLYHATP